MPNDLRLPGATAPPALPDAAVSDPTTWLLPEPTRVLLAGDTHGNLNWWQHLLARTAEHDCDGVVQVGDFGYWRGHGEPGRYLRALQRQLRRAGRWLLWIDGNHECHPDLRARYPWQESPQASGITPLTDRIFYAHRGARWTWRGRRWAALGGAVSEDVDTRIPGVEWWPEETITIAETQRLLTGCPRLGHVGPTVDVLLTHDVPAGIKTASRFLLSPQLAARVAAHRQLLGEAVTAVQPRLLVHGHLHLRHSAQLPLPGGSAVAVEGLASDDQRDPRSWAVLDLTTPPYAPTPDPTGPTAWFAQITRRRGANRASGAGRPDSGPGSAS